MPIESRTEVLYFTTDEIAKAISECKENPSFCVVVTADTQIRIQEIAYEI